jgi:TRAP-type mannitol/chloroaromatic compound transport system permease small subunit
LVLFYEVVARYVFNAPTIWAHDTAGMLGGTIAAVGLAYTHLHHGHIRIDLLYRRLSPRGKVLLDVVCALVLFFPLTVLLAYSAADAMWDSWIEGEVLMASFWFPPAGPIRTVVLVGCCLFVLQGAAHFIRDLHMLIRNKPL